MELYYDAGTGTVLEYIEPALDFLENNKGAHDLCLIKFGDWNDSLTTVSKEGRGVSVWLKGVIRAIKSESIFT